MSALISFVICGTLLVLILFTALFVFVRAAREPLPLRLPRLGWMALALYLCGALAAHLLLWWSDTEDVLLATMLFGMPWSVISVFVLRSGLVSAAWGSGNMIEIFSLVGISLNSWLVYQLGQRLPVGEVPQRRALDDLPR
jgi:amino acid transporter